MIKAENSAKNPERNFSKKNPKISGKIPKNPKNFRSVDVGVRLCRTEGYFPKFFLRGVFWLYPLAHLLLICYTSIILV